MSKFNIEWLENKMSKAGRPYKSLSLKKEDGSMVNATVFSSFINFANLKPGDSVDGELKANDYQGKTTYVLEMLNASPRAFGGFKGGTKIEEVRAENIKQAQERKSESIAYFNSVNSAIAVTEHMTNPINFEEKKEELIKWRDWFLKEFDNWNNKSPF